MVTAAEDDASQVTPLLTIASSIASSIATPKMMPDKRCSDILGHVPKVTDFTDHVYKRRSMLDRHAEDDARQKMF
jgi:hypothetical protein